MKWLLIILLFLSTPVLAQSDSIKVRITKMVVKDSVTHVWMRTEKGIKLYTACKCQVTYKKNDVLWIKKPE